MLVLVKGKETFTWIMFSAMGMRAIFLHVAILKFITVAIMKMLVLNAMDQEVS